MKSAQVLALAVALAAPLLPLGAAPYNTDAYTYRAKFGETVTRNEIAKVKLAEPKHNPSFEDAERLADLTLALNSASRADYELKSKRVAAERRRVLADLSSVLNGKLKPEWRENRWIKDYSNASDTVARELFLRVFVDQFDVTTNLSAGENEAYSYLLDYDNEQSIRENARWLRGVLAKIGWFDISKYGPEASQAAWLLIQHADYDPQWQRTMLAALQPKAAAHEMQPKYYAYLVDRVAFNSGVAETYATQGHCVLGGAWEPFSLVDPARVDERRASVGLEPLADYKARFGCR